MKRYANRYGVLRQPIGNTQVHECRHGENAQHTCGRCDELVEYACKAELPTGYGASGSVFDLTPDASIAKVWPCEEVEEERGLTPGELRLMAQQINVPSKIIPMTLRLVGTPRLMIELRNVLHEMADPRPLACMTLVDNISVPYPMLIVEDGRSGEVLQVIGRV